MKYESLSKYLVKLNQRFATNLCQLLILKSGHRLCLITIGKKLKN